LIRNQSVEPEMWGRVLGGTRNTSHSGRTLRQVFSINWRTVDHLHCEETLVKHRWKHSCSLCLGYSRWRSAYRPDSCRVS